MSKKGKDFKAGDFIFAKVKGYPAWPARIRGRNGKKFFVYFYGTGETANLMPNVLYDYKDNKDKFLAKPMKRRDFNDGLLQINYEIENNVPLPAEGEEPEQGATESAADNDVVADDSTAADSTMETDADITLNETAASGGDDSKVNDSPVNDSAVNESAVNDSAVNENAVNDSTLDEPAEQDDSDESNQPLVIDEDKKSRKTKAPATPRSETKRKIVTPNKSAEDTASTPSAARGRGRPKRAAEESPTVVATPAKKRRNVEPVTPAETEEPTEEPAKGTADEPALEAAEEPAEEPAKEPAEEPAEEPVEKPTKELKRKRIGETETQDKEDPAADTEPASEAADNLDVTSDTVTPKGKKVGRSKTSYHTVSLADLSELKEPFKDVLADDGKPKQNVLLVRLPNQRYVGIKLFQDRPKTFKTPAAKLSWESRMAQNAIDLRHKLESGLIKPSHIPNELVTELNLSEEDKQNIEKEKEIEEKRYRLNFLRTEMKLGELAAKIKCSLGLQKADTRGCVALMEELLTLDIKPLMLYKNHRIVETVKRLRSYVGDTHNWTMTEDELQQFTKDASRIRKKAEDCYQCFKLLFPEPEEGVTFFQQFSLRHGLFHACTKTLSEDEMLELVHEPPEMLDSSNPIQPILHAMNEDDDEAVPKKRRKIANITTPAKPTPVSATKAKRGRPSRNSTQTDVETSQTNMADKEKETPDDIGVSEKEKENVMESEARPSVDKESEVMDVDKASDSVDKDNADDTPNTSTESADKQTDKSYDKASSNKSDKADKVSSKSGDSYKDKEKEKHSKSSDKSADKSVKSKSDDSSKHSSSKHSYKTSEKDKSTYKSSSDRSDRSDRSDKSSTKSDRSKSDRKSTQEKSEREDSVGANKKGDGDKAGTPNGSKDSDKSDDRGDRRERERSSSGVNGTERDVDTDKTTNSKKAEKIRKSSSSSSSHQSDSSKYSSKRKSIK